MLFDIRGRRKNVVKVVYAVLALLMGGSLFLTVGPFNLGELVGSSGSGSSEQVFDEQAERIEGRLAKDPTDEALLLALTRARISGANAQAEIDPQTGLPGIPPPEAKDDLEQALETWNRYLKQAGSNPNPSAAQLVATTFFGLAERGSASYAELRENVDVAVAAQRIVAEQLPNLGSFSSLAIYEFFDGNFAAGDKAVKQAVATVPKAEAKNIEKQLDEYRQRAKRFAKQSAGFEKAEKQAGREQLENPFGGLGGTVPGE